jgi:uncharacterized membrane protein (DUF485 family)
VDKDTVKRILENPKYNELVSKRSSFGWKLSIVMLVIYYAFILIIAFNPSALGASLGGVTTVGIPVGIVIIISAFILTGIYVKRANSEFDELTQAIKDDVRDNK